MWIELVAVIALMFNAVVLYFPGELRWLNVVAIGFLTTALFLSYYVEKKRADAMEKSGWAPSR